MKRHICFCHPLDILCLQRLLKQTFIFCQFFNSFFRDLIARNLYGQGRLGNTIAPTFSKIPLIGPSIDRLLDSRNTAVFDEVERGLLSPMYGVNLMRNAAPHRLEYPDAGPYLRRTTENMARGAAGGGLLGYMRQSKKKKEK